MKLPTTSPTDFCRAYIERDLKEYHEKKIYMSSWPTMENLITRSIELDGVFTELIEKFGYSDRDSLSENRHSVWLILELIWSSHEFQPEDIIELKKNLKKVYGLTVLSPFHLAYLFSLWELFYMCILKNTLSF